MSCAACGRPRTPDHDADAPGPTVRHPYQGTIEPTPLERAERIAQKFHEVYETLAPAHGYETRRESAVPWSEVPERNRSLMVATVAELLARGVIR